MSQDTDEDTWPTVAVVIATRDRPELLRQALAAVSAQDYPGHVETVVVYDRSEPDTTLATAGVRPVRVLTNSRSPGLAGSRNTGVLATSSDLVAFCDDDDAWWPARLRTQVEALRRTSCPLALVTTGIRVVYGGREVVRRLEKDLVSRADLLRSRLTELHPSTFLLHRELLDEIGLVDEELPGSYAEDYDLLLRAAASALVVNVREPLVDVRWHPQSYFAGRWEVIADALDVLLRKHPDFRTDPAGEARIRGQRAFALAAAGRRKAALEEAVRTVRLHAAERRAYLAVLAAAGLVDPDWLLRRLNARGRSL
ncbi:glycosyltransferase family 2 protein [Pseudokineococcus basanitobsidens]|uniref:Glycosyltransferase family 2 protein n=1 Tax=Pseudokineococcus basanitobsidens TaxID=1926649 RepID=A0ABU8RMY6_9ACTN